MVPARKEKFSEERKNETEKLRGFFFFFPFFFVVVVFKVDTHWLE